MASTTNPTTSLSGPAGAAGADRGRVLRDAVEQAIRAPSAHNTQPWRFRITDEAVDVLADRTRRLPVADPDDRELTISCGAVIDHLERAIRHLGMDVVTTLLPSSGDPDLLARVRVGERIAPSPEEETLFDAIPLRRTNRRRYEPRPVPEPLVDDLLRIANRNGVWARTVEGAAREAVGALVEEAVAQQWADRAFREELAGWLRPATQGDGLSSLYLKGWGPFFVRHLNLGRRKSRQERRTVESTPLVIAIGSATDEPRAWLETGRALSTLLLRARADGLDAAYHNEAVQVPGTRSRLRDTIGVDGYPQLLLRLGYGPEVPASPRQPLHHKLSDEPT